ncbi:hypothetical protein [Micromonospora chokoriensis]|uniref:hypothetical protein n=1 Tax=Micromonospora chokoriensis TaxID=356851 RepID=UPI000B5AFF9C|nr:hypothetical protein [Micromonospora chokoriensis]
MAEYPQDVVQRFHGTPEQVDAGLVGELPRSWGSVVIEDTAEESGYLPALERLGYRLVLREPW